MGDCLQQLETLLSKTLDRCNNEKYLRVTSAIQENLPEIITGLKSVITDPSSSPAERLEAVNLGFSVWDRCLKQELQVQRNACTLAAHNAKIAEAGAARRIADAKSWEAKAVVIKDRKRIKETLRRGRKDAAKVKGDNA